MGFVGFQPAKLIDELADNCVKCGRPLTNPRSRRARVGTTCIQRYGAQPRRIANPAHAEWRRKRAKAEADRAMQQATYNVEFEKAKAEYDASVAAYQAAKATR